MVAPSPASFVLCATDTGVGKTTFSLLWSHWQEFGPDPKWAYFKPVETGESDSQRLSELGPITLVVYPPLGAFQAALVPHRAAALEGAAMPPVDRVVHEATQHALSGPVLLETFGGPFSPWNEHSLQIDIIRRLAWPLILVGSTTLGGVGRMITTIEALGSYGVKPKAIALFGEDAWTINELSTRLSVPLFNLSPPTDWTIEGIKQCALSQTVQFAGLANCLIANPGRTQAELVRLDAERIWHPYAPTRQREAPLAVVAAQDEFVTLADGRVVVDAISSWWTILYGHKGNQLAKEMADLTLDHVQFAGITHPGAVDLAGLLLESAKMPKGRVFYSDNGSTAVEVALKLAWLFWRKLGQPQRNLFIGFENAYHGDTFATMSVARHPLFSKGFEPLLFESRICPLDPLALDQLLQREGGKVAAVVLEPLVQGAAGMVMHSPQTLGRIWEACLKHNVLLIADEVMTGGGRTGKIWAHQHVEDLGLPSDYPKPDLIAAGKTLGGGFLPLAATLVSPKVVGVLDSDDPAEALFHGHSYTAHSIACALGAKYWKRLVAEGPVDAKRIEAFWQKQLTPLKDHSMVSEVRICGSIAAVELALNSGYISPLRAKAIAMGLKYGVLWRPIGNVLYAMPPYCTSESSLVKIAGAFKATVNHFGD